MSKLNERELIKILHAKVELIETIPLWNKRVAQVVVTILAPDIMKLIRQEVSLERRK